MSSMKHNTNNTPDQEHGSIVSYVVGFILSLVFTFIPYYLVTERVVAGTALMLTILAFAVIQTIIQIVFFLHIGREKNPRWQLGFFISTVAIILVVVGASQWIMHHLHYNMTPVTAEDAAKRLIEDEGIYQIEGEKTGACRGEYTTHKVTLRDGNFEPAIVTAKECDRITFINEDSETREIVYGTPSQSQAYGGEDRFAVRKTRPKTIILNDAGTQQFYDGKNPQMIGRFSVEP